MSLGWLGIIPLHMVLAAVAVEMSVTQMLKMHLSFVKVSFAVAAEAENHILLTFLTVSKELYSHVSKCLKIYLL